MVLAMMLAGAGIMAGCSKGSSNPNNNNNNNGNGNSGASVSIQNYAFAPDTLRVQAGTTVTWTNTDAVTHTVTALNNDWNSGNVAPGTMYKYTFPAAGTFSYHCTIHSMMKPGVVIVSGNTGNGNGY